MTGNSASATDTAVLPFDCHLCQDHTPAVGGRILPLQRDFSAPGNVVELRRLLDQAFDPEPILISLRGTKM